MNYQTAGIVNELEIRQPELKIENPPAGIEN